MKNISLLIRKFFLENWKKEIITFTTFFFVMFLCGCFANLGAEIFVWLGVICVVISMIIKPATAFSVLGRRESAINYLTLPAFIGEKLFSNIIISHVYQSLAFVLVTFTGLLAGFYLPGLPDYNTNFPLFINFNPSDLFAYISIILFIQAMFLFGSIYFKRLAFLKIFLFINVTAVFFTILNIILVVIGIYSVKKRFDGNFYIDNNDMSNIFTDSGSFFAEMISFISNNISLISGFVFLSLTIGIWALSYLRLKETEV